MFIPASVGRGVGESMLFAIFLALLAPDLPQKQAMPDDRLSEADQERLITAFTAGTSERRLFESYGISESSVKRLNRQHGPSKPSSGLC
jgi:hypothetical protein